jgi:cytochrome o ubiquinol oxidase subunit 2
VPECSLIDRLSARVRRRSFRKRSPSLGSTRRRLATAIAATPLAFVGGCDVLRLGVANPAGPVAEAQWHLLLIVGAVLFFVAAPVLILTPIIAWHYRLGKKGNVYRPTWTFSWPLEGLIWIPPTGIVVGLGFVLWHYTIALDPYRPLPSTQPALEVQAVALDWKWLFIYPDQGAAAVNQMAIPVGRPVHVSLTSGTVMQSLLIPQLAGQIYAMAGMTTQLNFAANRPGTFRGQNTQFNGLGFQNQKFEVLAMPPDAFEAWVARARATARPLDPAALDGLMQKSVPPEPILYSSVPPDLFQTFIARTQEPSR